MGFNSAFARDICEIFAFIGGRGTTAHYTAIYCRRQQTVGLAVCSQQTHHRSNQPIGL